MIKGHGGNIFDLASRLGCSTDDIIDMSSNLNPLGPPPGLSQYLSGQLHKMIALPEVDARSIIHSFSSNYDIDPEGVLAGNGTTQFIYTIPRALESEKVLIVGPTYSDYADGCKMNNVQYDYFLTCESNNFQINLSEFAEKIKSFDTIFICNPNNPTGSLVSKEKIMEICEIYLDKFFIIDESYLPFVMEEEYISLRNVTHENVIVLNSMSKIFSIPGLRIGFLISSHDIRKKIEKYSLPWNVNALAHEAVSYVMENREIINSFTDSSKVFFKTEKEIFVNNVSDIKQIQLFPGATYFMIAKVNHHFSSRDVCSCFEKKKILIRDCSNFQGLSDKFVRFSLKTRGINQKLVELLKGIFIED